MSDLEAKLSAEEFELQRYVREVAMRFDSVHQLKHHKMDVLGLANDTSQKLKENVYKNYELFIDTSKEISALEGEMYQLSHLLHEHEVLTHTLQAITDTDERASGPSDGTGDKPDKQSIASLLETVEGCSSVTEVPGRYLVHSSHLVELDQESFEAVQLVRAFLLNDSLMIGSMVRTKRRGPVRYRFQALYELDSMAIVNVKDSDFVSNAFKVLMFPDSHLYQAENKENKRQWTELLEATKQQHKAARDAIKREVHDAGNNGAEANGSQEFGRTSKAPTLESEHRQAELLAAESLRDVPERLDVYIAQREFSRAVDEVVQTKAVLKEFTDSHALRDVRARLNHRVNQLCKILMKDLETSPSGSLRGGPRAARRAVGLLLRLGHSAKACELFLANHSQLIRRDLDDVKMEEAASLYAANLSSAFFTGLCNAAQEFLRAFGENHGSYSAFVVWCNDQLKLFTRMSTPVVFNNPSLANVAECVLAATKECDELSDIGIDLNFSLMSLYQPNISQALCEAKQRIIDECDVMAKTETWRPMHLKNDQPQLAAIIIEMENLGVRDFRNKVYDGGIVDLSCTTVTFCKGILSFITEVFRFYTPEILADFVDCFSDMFKFIVNLFIEAVAQEENVPNYESIMGDAEFIVETVLPTTGARINEETEQNIVNLVELLSTLKLKLEHCGSVSANTSHRGSSVEPDMSLLEDCVSPDGFGEEERGGLGRMEERREEEREWEVAADSDDGDDIV